MTSPEQDDLANRLSKPFSPEEYEAVPGRAGRTYTAVSDESVIRRLTEVFGVDGVDIRPIDKIVEDRAVLMEIVAGGTRKAGWGVATNPDSSEWIKEAETDAIRRVGRLFLVAIDVYEGKVAPGGAQQPSRAASSQGTTQQAARPATPQPVAPADPTVVQREAERIFGDDAVQPKAGDPCPKHPTERLRGGDKGPSDLYHKDGERADGKAIWCSPYRAPRAPRR